MLKYDHPSKKTLSSFSQFNTIHNTTLPYQDYTHTRSSSPTPPKHPPSLSIRLSGSITICIRIWKPLKAPPAHRILDAPRVPPRLPASSFIPQTCNLCASSFSSRLIPDDSNILQRC
ncbi:Uncharacterized protein HZ326_7999 [Fusarium oxysporum f. sp. albedinis]|nr:Uncharacterized protein HZ326_7999 [Fusarium oxysporum f. sp. albedinis]